MATDKQRARRRAQRATAKAVKENRTQLPKAVTKPQARARTVNALETLTGKRPMPEEGTWESKELARQGSLSRYGKADPRFEAAFKRYWYHRKEINMGPDAVTYEEGNESDRDDSEDENTDEN
jgi:hypothetical protein